MSDDDNLEQKQKLLANELIKIHKLKLLLSIIKSVNVNKLNDCNSDELKKNITVFSIQNYLKLEGAECLLGLDNSKNVLLTYTEGKTIRQHVIEEIPKICKPIFNYIENIKHNCPPGIFNSTLRETEFLALEEKRQKLSLKLYEVKNKKCELLKIYAEKKLGSHLKNNLHILLADYKLNQIKARTLQGYILHEFYSRTDHTIKAIKEVESYIDEKLDE